jgi:hypothetical protein
VAERVVQRLRSVEVHEQHGDSTRWCGARQRIIEIGEERRAVRQSREAVVPCVVDQPVAFDGDSGQPGSVAHRCEMLG